MPLPPKNRPLPPLSPRRFGGANPSQEEEMTSPPPFQDEEEREEDLPSLNDELDHEFSDEHEDESSYEDEYEDDEYEDGEDDEDNEDDDEDDDDDDAFIQSLKKKEKKGGFSSLLKSFGKNLKNSEVSKKDPSKKSPIGSIVGLVIVFFILGILGMTIISKLKEAPTPSPSLSQPSETVAKVEGRMVGTPAENPSLTPRLPALTPDFEIKSVYINDRGFLLFKALAEKETKLKYLEVSLVKNDSIVHCMTTGDTLIPGLNDLYLECDVILDPGEVDRYIFAYKKDN